MKDIERINSESLNAIANKCYAIYTAVDHRGESLVQISQLVSGELGEYFSPDILDRPDEISIYFIELLDQIVFEIAENYSGSSNIQEYIIDDLHSRLGVFLEVFKDIELYKNNLSNRVLIYEDTLIIKHYEFEQYVPRITQDFYHNPNLQISFMKTLLTFDTAELIDFYISIFNEEVSIEVKILALIGVKMFNRELYDWEQIEKDVANLNGLVGFVEHFDPDCLESNVPPTDIYSLFFVFSYIELFLNKTISCDVIQIMSLALESISTNSYADHSFLTNIYNSISNIIINYDLEALHYILNEEKKTRSLIYLIDFLPKEFFDRIAVKLSMIGDQFIESVRKLVKQDKVNISTSDSNVNSYILWNADQNIGKI